MARPGNVFSTLCWQANLQLWHRVVCIFLLLNLMESIINWCNQVNYREIRFLLRDVFPSRNIRTTEDNHTKQLITGYWSHMKKKIRKVVKKHCPFFKWCIVFWTYLKFLNVCTHTIHKFKLVGRYKFKKSMTLSSLSFDILFIEYCSL